MHDLLKDNDKKMEHCLSGFKNDLQGLRTGRASPLLLNTVFAEVYGAQMRLADVASISVPEPRQLLVTPFDATNVHAIAKGIIAANLNLNPQVEGNQVRVKIPEPDSASRKEMVKQVKRQAEDAKVHIRGVRKDSNNKAKKQKNEGLLAEDLWKSLEKKIQESTDKYCKFIDEAAEAKEKEITEI
ncbi:Ribosome-recycling factor [Candidatus Clavichlamydia salmonicola]|uniref:ribosome recycling factor n=1 Tax=Candidatus Clavichlamydia salmonicola TaxID=469812 RepID=UPI0018915E15|nr:ribosome recycling factor [Candidatus Clavichlamydia salmonicola]MBF5050711.1 Ribosome-recycling factor [Candidatus Clavichlamydia salmonicola]